MINGVITDYDQMKQRVSEWVEKQYRLNRKVTIVENGQRNNYILIFGLQKR